MHHCCLVASGTEFGSIVWVLARAARREMVVREKRMVVDAGLITMDV
jgi:hypothetical protein